ncbi:HK97 family phage prohead protease [Propionivibrio sp.]|uniref:phage major capsid protein n=1 Tax=Propionivibrio sp. TaxID=2212460 RepID=UPI003BF16779
MKRTAYGSIKLDVRAIAADRAVPCVLSTNEAIERGGYSEILDHSPECVDLTRAADGLALLLNHDQSKAIGRIDSITNDGSKLRGMARFGTSADAQQAKADVETGILPSLSVGYQISEYQNEANGVQRVTRWSPLEVSLVAIPADTGAGMYRSQTTNGNKMNIQTRSAIESLGATHRLPADFMERMLSSDKTIDQAKDEMLEFIATRDAGGPGRRLPFDEGHQVTASNGIANALDARLGIKGSRGDARSLVEIAVSCLELSGVRNARSMSRNEIATRAMSTSDFPALLADSAGRALAQAYAQSPSPLKAVSRQVSLPDFRSRTVIRLAAAPDLSPVNELGEFTSSYVDEASASYKLATYGKIISLSRQAIVNDDLGGFDSLLRKFGDAASRKEGDLLADLILSNPVIDGLALFHANRSTLLTGAGSALASAGIAAAVKALRLQKEIGGGFIQQTPTFLIVPAALELVARQAVFAISPVVTSAANPIEQGLQVIVEPRLDSSSVTAWYLVANSGSNSMEHAYLDGEAGVYIETRNGFETDGMDIKARLDFGCGFVAPTGWIKSAGA